jgi:hypothetical protein
MAEKKEKTYKIKFNSALPEREFVVNGTKVKVLPDGKKIKEQIVPKLVIKSGQTKEIDQATYDFMVDKDLLLTKEKKEEQDQLRTKYGGMQRNRAASESAPPNMTDEDKKLLSIDKPYVEE